MFLNHSFKFILIFYIFSLHIVNIVANNDLLKESKLVNPKKQGNSLQFPTRNLKQLDSACGPNAFCIEDSQCSFGFCQPSIQTCLSPGYALLLNQSCSYDYQVLCEQGYCESAYQICYPQAQYTCPCSYFITGIEQLRGFCQTGYCSYSEICDLPRWANESCIFDSDCESGYCNNSICLGIAQGQDCSYYFYGCAMGLYCSEIDYLCHPLIADGANCTVDEVCRVGHVCTAVNDSTGVCATQFIKTQGQNCNYDSECLYDLNCDPIAKQCLPATLTNPIVCNNTNICYYPYGCECSDLNGDTQCVQHFNNTCNVQAFNYYSCLSTYNCPYIVSDIDNFFLTSRATIPGLCDYNCREQFADFICCQTNFNHYLAKNYNYIATNNVINCNAPYGSRVKALNSSNAVCVPIPSTGVLSSSNINSHANSLVINFSLLIIGIVIATLYRTHYLLE